jgi:hypothetical protein
MPKSETEFIEYYPSGWTEEKHDDSYVEWVYDDDQSVCVRLDGTLGEGYSVTPVTGVNSDGEEFVTRPMSGLSEEQAFEVAQTLVYAINGAIGRVTGEAEFNGSD